MSRIIDKPRPPGPKGRFLVGMLPELSRDWLTTMQAHVQTYGEVVWFEMPPLMPPMVLLTNPDHIEQVLVTDAARFRKSKIELMIKVAAGNGIFASEGDFWRRQRRLMQPPFHRNRVAGYADEMLRQAEAVVRTWRVGETRDIYLDSTRLALRIAARTMFGADVEGEADEAGRAMGRVMESFNAWLQSRIPLPPSVPTPSMLRMRKAVRRLDRIIYRFIEERRSHPTDKDDLLSLLLLARDEEDGSGMTDRQVRDEAMTLFLAGFETTALALAWTFYLLARFPAVAQKLRGELSEVLGSRPATAADLPRLAYLDLVIKESLRIYPPAWVMSHAPIEDYELAGYRIPRGTTLLMSPWINHYNHKWFAEPGSFRPERWADGLAKRIPRFAYFPFGGGPRVCIGNAFAQLEMAMVLATVVPRFDFAPVADELPEPYASFTLRPRRTVKLTLCPPVTQSPSLSSHG